MALTQKQKDYKKKWRARNLEKVREQQRVWQKEWRLKNLEKERKKQREWQKKWRRENPEEAKRRHKLYREKYKERRSKTSWEYQKKRMKEDIRFKIRCIYSSAISGRLRKRFSGKNCKSTFDYLPYTIDDLMKRLESRFQEGMSWENYGEWHIDHIIPDCKFDYKSPEDKEFRDCWALENLQPLWAIDNLRKGGSLIDEDIAYLEEQLTLLKNER